MVLVGGIVIIVGFFIFMKLFGLVEKSTKVINLAKSAVKIVRDAHLDDYQKEIAMQKHAKELLSLFFLITIGGIMALAIPFSLIWLMELAKLLTVTEVIETTLSFQFIAVAFIISIGYFWLMQKKQPNKYVNQYSITEKILHKLAFKSWSSQVSISNIESHLYKKKIIDLEIKKPVFITAADIGQKTLKVFSSKNMEDQAWPAWEVCRAATAAETYFPSWKGFADGGIYANNPSMVALAAAVKILGAKIEDIEILSIGTGESCDSGVPPEGRLTTAIWVLRAMLNGASVKMHNYFVKSLPVKKYTRIQFVCDPGWGMDNPKSMYDAEYKWAIEIQEAIKTVKYF